MKQVFRLFTLVAALFFIGTSANAQTADQLVEGVTVVKLDQVEGEYTTTSLNLKPGKYIFEVTNTNVDKDLGFYLTPKGQAKNQVANSGLSSLVGKEQTARTGVVELKAGTYEYSCPLNPTPKYAINVKGGHGM